MSHKALILPGIAKAWVLQDRPTPEPGPEQILIETRSIALNPADWKDQVSGGFIKAWPAITGRDVSGSVVAIGPKVEEFKVGDRVAGFCISVLNGDLNQGAFQEYAVLQQHLCIHIPDSVSFEAAATMPVSIASAAGVLRQVGVDIANRVTDAGGPYPGILIWGGASSVGISTIQLAVTAGYQVFTTASPQNHSYLQELGAAVVFDYRDEDITEKIAEAVKTRRVVLDKFVDTASADLFTTGKVVGHLGGGELATLLPWELVTKENSPANVTPIMSGARSTFADKDFTSWVFNEMTGKRLADRTLKAAQFEVIPGGLLGIEPGLERLRNGVSALKLVVNLEPSN